MKFTSLAYCIVFAVSAISHRVQAATLQADYRLQHSLESSVSGISSLTYLAGVPTYTTDTVDGQSREVLSVPAAAGPQALFNGFVSSSNYSVVLLASFSIQPAPATKLLDFKNLTSDSGLYINNGLLDFFNADGLTIGLGGAPLITNGYGQIVLTRDGSTTITTVYVNGTEAFSFIDTSGLAVVSATNTTDMFLTFFKDDTAGLGTPEDTTGNIARIRLYDGVLTGEEISLLDRVQPVPEPGVVALLLAAGGILLACRKKAPHRATPSTS